MLDWLWLDDSDSQDTDRYFVNWVDGFNQGWSNNSVTVGRLLKI